jgi:hypothetical protein
MTTNETLEKSSDLDASQRQSSLIAAVICTDVLKCDRAILHAKRGCKPCNQCATYRPRSTVAQLICHGAL